MTVSVCVTRVPGCCIDPENVKCNVGDDISDALIQNEVVAVSAGRAFLDDEQYDEITTEGECSLHGCIPPGSIVKASDRVNGTYQAEVTLFSINISRSSRGDISAYSALKLRRYDI